ncbi:hypothetical protein EON79_17685 [bacterium]|nr:MAG: hypothetical protein EON79_17685 [bacterium]
MARKSLAVASAALGALVVYGAFSCIRREVEGDTLLKTAKEHLHEHKAVALGALVPPAKTYSRLDYTKVRTHIAGSYNPDPPLTSADEVMEYRTGVRIVLLFIEGGRVTLVYSGLT